MVRIFKKKRKPISVTTDVIFHKPSEVLLIRRKNKPFKGMWALPGGFLEADEAMVAGAIREFEEETNLKLNPENTYLFSILTAVDRDPRGRVITFVFSSDCYNYEYNLSEICAKDDATEIAWFDVNNLPKLAFDHEETIKGFFDVKYKELAEYSDTKVLN